MDSPNPSGSARVVAEATPWYCPACSAPVGEDAAQCGECGVVPSRAGWPRDPLVGQIVGDKYRLLRRLGEGAFGVVYLADHVTFGAHRAVKVLHDRLTYDAQIVARFRREAEAIYRLTADAIVRLEDFGELRPGVPFMAMEYAEGESLAAVLAREAPLPLARALGIVRQIVLALMDAASHGILHRDLKPGNIRVHQHPRRGEEVKVLDFGIAKILEEGTITRTGDRTLGTPGYMAPELWSGGEVDARADLFAGGVLLFEMLAGRLPWPVIPGEPLAVLVAMREHPAPRLSQVVPRGVVPPPVELLVDELLSAERDQRPRDAAAVLRRIDGLQVLNTSAIVIDRKLDATVRTLPALTRPGREELGPPPLSDLPTMDDARADLPGRALTPEELEVAYGDTRPTPRVTAADREQDAGRSTRRGRAPKSGAGPGAEAGSSRLGWLLLLSVLLLVGGSAGLGLSLWPELFGLAPGSGDGTGDGAARVAGAGDGSGLGNEPGGAPEGMVLVPAGQSVVGQSPAHLSAQVEDYGEVAANYAFAARSRTFVPAFYIDRHEVPVASFLEHQRSVRSDPAARAEYEARCPASVAAAPSRENPRAPARNVSYYEAVMYCEARGTRLPTYLEWERAARGDDGRRFPWGDGPGREGAFNAGAADQPPWVGGASVLDGFAELAPVGALAAGASPWGVEGLAGNVSEWVAGPDGSVDRPPFFHRGGSYLSHPLFMQSFAYQFVSDPCAPYETIGFRCAADAQ